MKKIFILMALIFSSTEIAAKVYDCFTFFNELEILEIRLNELYDHVDKFVLVEARETHRGASKPLYYDENKKRFERFSDKIIHVIVDELSTNTTLLSNEESGFCWARENDQRNQIMRGLIDCEPNDLILISDLDEIVRPSVIPEIDRILNESRDDIRLVICRQKLYTYFINRLDSIDWRGTAGILFKNLKKCSPQYCRSIRQLSPYVVDNGGWHFSYMGGYNRVVCKLSSFAHAECDTLENKSIKKIADKVRQLTLVDIDDTYPKYIINNLEKFKKNNFIDLSSSNNFGALYILPD